MKILRALIPALLAALLAAALVPDLPWIDAHERARAAVAALLAVSLWQGAQALARPLGSQGWDGRPSLVARWGAVVGLLLLACCFAPGLLPWCFAHDRFLRLPTLVGFLGGSTVAALLAWRWRAAALWSLSALAGVVLFGLSLVLDRVVVVAVAPGLYLSSHHDELYVASPSGRWKTMPFLGMNGNRCFGACKQGLTFNLSVCDGAYVPGPRSERHLDCAPVFNSIWGGAKPLSYERHRARWESDEVLFLEAWWTSRDYVAPDLRQWRCTVGGEGPHPELDCEFHRPMKPPAAGDASAG